MKRIYFVLWVCLFAGVLFAQSTKELYLFHTNDMHSRVEPFPEDFQDTMLADKAGLLRRATFIKQQRKIHDWPEWMGNVIDFWKFYDIITAFPRVLGENTMVSVSCPPLRQRCAGCVCCGFLQSKRKND